MKKHYIISGILAFGLACAPFIATAFQQTPTNYANNVTGRLAAAITTTQTTGITITADSYRTPGGTAAVKFGTGTMILKLSRRVGSLDLVEYIGVDSATQSSDTVTLGTVTRYLSSTEGSNFSSLGAGLSFPAGSIVELVWGVHQAENTVFKNNVNELTGSGRITKAASGSAIINIPSVTTTERDAFEVTKVGDVVRNETLGIWQIYEPGGWVQFSSGSVVNAGYATAGKTEFGTPTEMFNQTASGSTNAGLTVAVKDVVHDSGSVIASGAVSYVVATSGSTIDRSLIAVSPGSGDLLQVQSNGDITGRSTSQLGISTGFKHEATVTAASADVVDPAPAGVGTGTLVPTWTGTGVDANSLKVGSVIHIKLGGNYDMAAAGGNLDLRLMVAGVAVGEFEMANQTGDDSTWELDAYITVRTIGASGTAMPSGVLTYGSLTVDAGGSIVANMQGFDATRAPASSFTLNSTVQAPIALTAHFSVYSASNFVNIQTGSITVTNP